MASRALTSGTCGRALTVVTLVAIGVSGCGDDDGAGVESADVVVSDAWARSSPAGVADGVAYMTVESPVDDQLVGVAVSADVAASVALHETMVVDGTGTDGTATETSAHDMTDDMAAEMTMRHISAVVLPAGETVNLAPGGLHVMLVDLAGPLESGSSFDLTLTFATAAPETVTVDVRDEAP